MVFKYQHGANLLILDVAGRDWKPKSPLPNGHPSPRGQKPLNGTKTAPQPVPVRWAPTTGWQLPPGTPNKPAVAEWIVGLVRGGPSRRLGFFNMWADHGKRSVICKTAGQADSKSAGARFGADLSGAVSRR